MPRNIQICPYCKNEFMPCNGQPQTYCSRKCYKEYKRSLELQDKMNYKANNWEGPRGHYRSYKKYIETDQNPS